jgi:hypothetical protein
MTMVSTTTDLRFESQQRRYCRLHSQPLIQKVTSYLSLEAKRRGDESGHCPPSSTEVKNGWIYAFTPACTFM